MISDYNEFVSRQKSNFGNDLETSFVFNPLQSLPISEQRERLPIRKYLKRILYCLEKYQVLILVGETGSGKSTQLPQFLFEWGWHHKGLIGITEPRRISAITLAERVALEQGESIGGNAGFVVQFLRCVSNDTVMKYVTEGILLRELLADPLLMQYGVVMIDEVHERTVLTDILLALLKKICKKRDSFKLIISSATLNTIHFESFFDFGSKQSTKEKSTVVLSVDGRVHPVSLLYLQKPCADYLVEAVETVMKVHRKEARGDILVFLTGQEDVLQASDLLEEHARSEENRTFQVFPLYAALSNHEQLKAFLPAPRGMRKIVLATNVAETSITIPGIVYVIDSGFVKLKWFNPDTATESLVVVNISKAIAKQRAGRAGRVRPGKVFRLYTEEDFNKFPDHLPPEICRIDLSSVILNLKAFGIENILRFEFPSIPPTKNLLAAIETLYALEAIDETTNLTKPIGYVVAELPFSPMVNKMLYMSGVMGCSEEIIIIAVMLQVQSVFSKPSSAQGQQKARIAKRNFEVAEGDLIMLLNVFNAFVENNQSKEFCRQYFLIYRQLKYAYELREQVTSMMTKKFNIPITSCQGNMELLCKCIISGFFLNAACLHHSGVYKQIRSGVNLSVHPLSTFYTESRPPCVIYCELVETTQIFMRNITVVKEEWLTEVASKFYYRTTAKD